MSLTSTITQMQSNTAIAESKQEKKTTNDITDSNMFLKLMLKQMEQQDPTEPTDNSQWLAQMAQYSSLEAMNNLNAAFSEVSDKISALSDSVTSGNVISQTLSLVGKEVTVSIPTADNDGNIYYSDVTGNVDEVSFENGDGVIKVNGQNYSLSSIKSIRP
ncbi:hypothetical protein IKE67_02655 [bacterium]|nr:hypothetical protein [bacterium]